MSLGLVGRKIGMTRVFTEEGRSRPVTVVEVLPNRITQIKTRAVDGYDGIQVTTGERRPNRVTSALKGHYAKAGTEPGRGLWEFRLNNEAETALGTELTVGLFSEGQKVDVSGQTIGKGFAGAMKRYGFGGGRATHGNSKAHRLAGSIGNAQDPGRVFKGKKMAGHMGAENASQQNLDVVRVDEERNIILIAGSIPGSKGTDVIIRPATKSDVELELPSGAPVAEEPAGEADAAAESAAPETEDQPQADDAPEASETNEDGKE